MNHDPSRKSFLAKMFGLVAVAGAAPRLLAQSAANRKPADAPAATATINLRLDARAVARRADSL